MKLRNKRTGEIVEWEQPISYKVGKKYYSLAELSAEWEDAPEEPVRHWFISGTRVYEENGYSDEGIASLESVGNHFKSKEDAKKAVEKLRAFKRLKDKGLRFNKWTIPEEPKTPHIKLVIEAEMDVPNSPYDLDLLFSGGEE